MEKSTEIREVQHDAKLSEIAPKIGFNLNIPR